ncbi:hypothetical protein [Tabrizicola sp.]|uniref:hypothetical protein n=1 Tax=Tabrizicola sp. TaxID=2005166 RepID=UPI002733ADB6|nr:hypothetical protein [Tabrizicola sp.]MDP3195989.1 hypothetical protein [Tabrizicola sp.]
MDTDLALTVGILLLVLSVPSLLSAWVESRAPRLGAILFIGAGALILYALTTHPGGYAFREVPGVMINVLIGFFD